MPKKKVVGIAQQLYSRYSIISYNSIIQDWSFNQIFALKAP